MRSDLPAERRSPVAIWLSRHETHIDLVLFALALPIVAAAMCLQLALVMIGRGKG